jgi:hypothetical protein
LGSLGSVFSASANHLAKLSNGFSLDVAFMPGINAPLLKVCDAV